MITCGRSSFAVRSSRADLRLVSANIGHGISASDMHRVEEIWQELGDNGNLPPFEGTILNALDVTSSDGKIAIECGLMRYRCVVARSYENLPSIKPVAVSGLLESCASDGDVVLLGRRSWSVSTHAGWFETPPSGGLEVVDVNSDGSIDIISRLATELLEETGIERSAVIESNIFGLYYDDPTGTIDVVVRLNMGSPAPRINSTQEYTELRWMRQSEISALLQSADTNVVNVSRWILNQWLREIER
jgi:hypothetical protein